MTEGSPERLIELPEGTRVWLAGLRPNELETLQEVVTMPADDVRDGFKMVRDLRTVTRFFKYLIIGAVAIFIATVGLYENALKVIGWIKGGPTP
ncbi:hypothetical protein C8J36_103512 [Rhizobium sp. PP-F2F-G48]|uniref:hypothetical protein n=1 Tax=Rhizobium sp. PP-F2F-G48 TaxID=2135651 RepID=UPI00104E89F6|nr:hypothetical protein [Rhizobium sp. PP-F2F-G48]TCM56142.1 hypothetical protein C8J36_103512 [Rhizobium sp. PP-F2F-G48]